MRVHSHVRWKQLQTGNWQKAIESPSRVILKHEVEVLFAFAPWEGEQATLTSP